MFDFLFDPSIEQINDYYIFKGIPYYPLYMDFQNAYGTTYLPKAILEKINRYSFRVHKFFLVEFHYTLVRIINQRRLKTPLDKLLKLQLMIETETWFERTINLKNLDDFNKVKDQFHTKAEPLQDLFLRSYKSVKYAYYLKGWLLDGKVGSGKTLAAIMWSVMVNNLPTIVVAPDIVVNSVWVKEFIKHFKRPPKVWTSLDESLPLDFGYDYYVIHYSALTSNQGESFSYFLKDITKHYKSPIKLIIDESHNFNDETSKRSQLMTAWADSNFFSDTLCLSGTPLKAQGRETFTLFTMIDALFVGKARKAFFELYGKSRENLNELLNHRIGRSKFTIPEVTGLGRAAPVETIDIEIPNGERFTLKNVRSEMMLYIEDRIKFYYEHLPVYTVFFWKCVDDYGQNVKSSKSDYADYERYVAIVKRFRDKGYRTFDEKDNADNLFCKKIEEEIMDFLPRDIRKEFKNVRSAVKYLGLKIRGEALGNVLGKMCIEAATALIRHAGIPTLIKAVKKKTLIFSSYVDTVKYTVEYLKENGFKPIAIYGEVSSERDASLTYLADDPTANPGVTTFKSLKEGVPCIFANQVIMTDSPYREYILTQVIARVWRKGQDEECFFWLLNLDTGNEINIASRSIDIMKWSAEQVDQLISKAAGYGGMDELKGVMGAECLACDIWEEEQSYPIMKRQTTFNIF